jgi:DNA-binding Lrp family transcriptional regulator
MSKSLDLKDKKILYELDVNCRQSIAQIAKKVGLSTEATHYRIKKLEESIITQYQLITNLSYLGIFQFKICIATQHLDQETQTEIISKVKEIKEVKWIVTTTGPWNLILSCEVKEYNLINNIKHEVMAHFKGYVRESTTALLTQATTLTRDFLLEQQRSSKPRQIMKSTTQVELDELDINILHSLATNARKTVVEIAQELNSTVRIITYRIKQLEKKEIIQGYKIAINYEQANIKLYKLFIYLSQPTQKEYKQLTTTLEQHPNCTHTVEVVGGWDLEPEFEVEEEKEFENILNNIQNKFKDIISQIDIITIKEEHKFLYF